LQRASNHTGKSIEHPCSRVTAEPLLFLACHLACCCNHSPSSCPFPHLPPHTALRFLRFAWEPFNTLIAFWLALAFHLLYAYSTQDSWVPDPRLLIWTGNAEATTHSAG
jgi:hypothetical protein